MSRSLNLIHFAEMIRQSNSHESNSREGPSREDSRVVQDVPIPTNAGQLLGERYRIEHPLGNGSFGKVFKCHDTLLHRKIAVKLLNTLKHPTESIKEFEILKRLQKAERMPGWEFVLRVSDWFFHENRLCFSMEILGCNISSQMEDSPNEDGYDIPQACFITKQVIRALSYLHFNGVVHADLKPSNIVSVLPGSLVIKIVDFGQSFIEGHRAPKIIQSLWYRAPEVLFQDCATTKIDIWSLGCTFVKLICGRALFPGQSSQEVVKMHCDILESIPRDVIARSRIGHRFFKRENGQYQSIKTGYRNEGLLRLETYIANAKYNRNTRDERKNILVRDFLRKTLKFDHRHRDSADKLVNHALFEKS